MDCDRFFACVAFSCVHWLLSFFSFHCLRAASASAEAKVSKGFSKDSMTWRPTVPPSALENGTFSLAPLLYRRVEPSSLSFHGLRILCELSSAMSRCHGSLEASAACKRSASWASSVAAKILLKLWCKQDMQPPSCLLEQDWQRHFRTTVRLLPGFYISASFLGSFGGRESSQVFPEIDVGNGR